MPDHDSPRLLAAARARVAGARSLLARPRACNLDECVTLLREAQGYLEWLRDSLPRAGSARPDLRGQALALAGEIRQAGVLLEQAARFGRRWLERLQSAAGYTAAGTCVPLQPRGQISLFG
ncbi:MAG TPA: hypothetical protein VKR61_21755 [Bryobacteraceae bacterium]|nr:hypothetical protein [Bryobacteraceae bacterium]